MNRLAGFVLFLGTSLAAQSIHSTLLALSDATAPRARLTRQLTDQMMALAKPDQIPGRVSVERFSIELTAALAGHDISASKASAIERTISDLMRGNGATFLRANALWQTLGTCGVLPYKVQTVVDAFVKIGQEIRGPDDSPVRNGK